MLRRLGKIEQRLDQAQTQSSIAAGYQDGVHVFFFRRSSKAESETYRETESEAQIQMQM